MNWQETALPGVLAGEPVRHEDARGYFARVYCRDAFAALGIDFVPAQASVSYNRRRGTLRGMHFQAAPGEERKLIRCTAGAVFDVVVDLRPDSPTHRRWLSATLCAEDGNALFVPTGLAHGFLTLTDGARLEYLIDVPFAPELARGVRWDDPAFAIDWPFTPEVMNERDRSWPDYAG